MNNIKILNSIPPFTPSIVKQFSLIFGLIISQSPEPERQFVHLKNRLESYGFQVVLEVPPRRGTYGLLEERTKKIWINPVVFDLGIARQTLIHEGVHAAQLCAGNGKIKALGLDLQPITYARPFFQHYTDIHRRDLEREAFAVQTQSNSLELVLSILEKYCQ